MSLSHKGPSVILPDISQTRSPQTWRKRLLQAILLACGLVTIRFASTQDMLDVTFGEENFEAGFPSEPAGEPGTMVLKPCLGPYGTKLECGYVLTPKDYQNTSHGTAAIAVARLPAAKEPAKGTIFINPGGPGGSGVSFLMRTGSAFHQLFGPEWNVVGFDPRGIGRTSPSTKCFRDETTESLLLENTPLHAGYTVPNIQNLSDPINRYSLAEQQRQFLAVKAAQAMTCKENMNVEDLRYMGTTTVARDIDFMTTVFDGDDAKIYFYGASYGTIIGSYLVNMFPDRIGKAVIDGVVDPIVWTSQPSHEWHKYWSVSAADAYDWFLEYCSHAGPDACPLASHAGESSKSIKARLEDFIQGLVERPLVAKVSGRPGYITSGTARGILFLTLSSPAQYQLTARAFANAMSPKQDGSLLLRIHQAVSAPAELTRLAVVCADSPQEFEDPTAEDLAEELLWGLRHSNGLFGAAMDYIEHDGGCEFWPTRGKVTDRFTGPWDSSLEYPLLVISNTADPDTPLANGIVVNQNMPNSSTMLIQNGPGHTSFAASSLCTLKAHRAYWAGSPPQNGTVCELDQKLSGDNKDTFEVWSVEDQKLKYAAEAIKMGLMRARRATGGLAELS